MAKVGVIVTVLNEESTIKGLIDSLINQTAKSTEIIVVDGGSTDRTIDILKSYKQIKVLQKKGNRSVGRNFAISKAKSPVIAITDAGCIPRPDWLGELTKPFSDSKVQVVSGYYEGLPKNIFQRCLVPYVLVMPDKIPSEFLPATRSMAIRKSVWANLVKFDERLFHNEDYAYAHSLKNKGVSFVFAPKAKVSWIPRRSLKSAAWMFLRFAIGDIQAGIFRPKVKLLLMRYYLFFFLIFIHPLFSLLAVPYILWSIIKNYRYVKDFRAFFWLPVIQLTADASVIFGTIIGFLSKTNYAKA